MLIFYLIIENPIIDSPSTTENSSNENTSEFIQINLKNEATKEMLDKFGLCKFFSGEL